MGYHVSLVSSDNLEFSEGLHEEDVDADKSEVKSLSFDNLKGGDTMYTITVAPVINSSRLKGKKISTKLLPSPPRNLKVRVSHAGKSSGEVDLLANWTLPRGHYESFEIRLTAVTESEDGQNINETEIVTLSKDVNSFIFEDVMEGPDYEVRLFSKAGEEVNKCN